MTLELAATIESGDITVTCELSVAPGETVAIVGPNGAGKSTVLRAIAGLEPVRSGHVWFDGDAWDEPATGAFVAPEARSVGMVFQRYLLFDHLSVRDNVAFGLRARGQRSSEARRTAEAVLTRLGLTTLADRRPPTLSGGQAQRVALARALAIEPGVVLLDEPLAAIDVAARPQLRSELAASLARTDVCRVLVTHDPVDAYALADRVIALEHGMVTQRGTLGELAVAPRTTFVADLLGTNLLRGTVRAHRFEVATDGDRAPFEITVGPHDIADGAALASIRPQAISLHRSRPEGSPRNVWHVTVSDIEHGADRVRVRLDIGLVAELTPAGAAAMHIARGDRVWASLKASEVAIASA